MRTLLLATVLLSTVMSDDSLMNDHQETEPRVPGGEVWPGRGRRIPGDVFRTKFDDFSTYGVDNMPRNPTLRAFGNPSQIPSFTLARPRYPQYGQLDPVDFGDLECRVVNPTLLVSVDFAQLLYKDNKPILGCNSKKRRRRTQDWQLQKPFYVEEPRWIEIEADYTDGFSHPLDTDDPFVLSRGKKIIRLRDSVDPPQKTLTNYEEVLNVLGKSRMLRSRQLVGSRKYEQKRNEQRDADSKRNDEGRRIESRKGSTYIGNLENLDTYEDPYILSRGKRMKLRSAVPTDAENFEDYYDNQEEDILSTRRVTRGKRSLETTDFHEESDDADNSKKSTQSPKTVAEFAKNHRANLTHFKEIPDAFHKSSTIKYKRKVNEGNDDRVQKEDSSLLSRFREKRDAKNTFNDKQIAEGYNDWLKNAQITDSNYFERRDKHSDILDILEQPFFISRGKKASNNIVSLTNESQRSKDYGAMKNTAINEILNELSGVWKCTSEECITNFRKIVQKKAPRDRRGILDELLTNYDPFYVARGKRTTFDNLGARIKSKSNNKMGSAEPLSNRNIESEIRHEISSNSLY